MLTVSVIIPTYNRARLLPRAIRSALTNLEPGDEILVVDDASTDDTAAVAAQFPAPVRYILAEHGGAGAARNRGVEQARGDLVAFLDSDDEWFPDKLRLQRRFLAAHPNVLYAFSDFRSKEDSGREDPRFLRHWHKDRRSWDEILAPGRWYSDLCDLPSWRADFRVHVGSMYLAEMQSDYMATSTAIIRRREAGDALRFAETLRISEDKACFGRVAGRGPGAFFDCETSIQWGHAGPRVSDTNHAELVTARLALYDEIWACDPQFVAQHGDELRRARKAQYLKRARWLLARCRTVEARADLQRAGTAPLSYRLFSTFPPTVARGLRAVGRFLKS